MPGRYTLNFPLMLFHFCSMILLQFCESSSISSKMGLSQAVLRSVCVCVFWVDGDVFWKCKIYILDITADALFFLNLPAPPASFHPLHPLHPPFCTFFFQFCCFCCCLCVFFFFLVCFFAIYIFQHT